MVPIIIATALAIVALDVTPATSQSSTVEPAKVNAPARANAANDPNRVICKGQPVTGSRFERRVCLTRTQWVDLERQRERALDGFERHLNENAGFAPLGGNSVPYD